MKRINVNLSNNYEHRRALKELKLVMKDGSPVKGQEVVITQTKHKFLFGAAAFESIPLVNGDLKEEERIKTEEEFKKFFEIFNYVTLPFYWGGFEPKQGEPKTEKLKKTAQWLVEKGCILKGHPLCWHTATAPWLMNMSNQEILAAQFSRIKREMTDFAGLIDIWDAINEVVIMPIFDKYDNGITRICKELGRIPTVKGVFAEAKAANPGSTLLINDFNTSTSYEILVEGCLEAGIPIDAIGIQSHMHQGYWGVEKTLEVLERFSHFNLPIHFTENSMVSGNIMPPEIEDLNDYKIGSWPTNSEGEERQAREVVSHYKTLFAHPLVESITWWNFVDGGWLDAPSGLVRKDISSKPAYEELKKLIKNEWWTSPIKVVTDETGTVSFEGFLGEYHIECGGKKVQFTLDKEEKLSTIVI
jgi:GH35 family endo-1,4-beta-xylanase